MIYKVCFGYFVQNRPVVFVYDYILTVQSRRHLSKIFNLSLTIMMFVNNAQKQS